MTAALSNATQHEPTVSGPSLGLGRSKCAAHQVVSLLRVQNVRSYRPCAICSDAPQRLLSLSLSVCITNVGGGGGGTGWGCWQSATAGLDDTTLANLRVVQSPPTPLSFNMFVVVCGVVTEGNPVAHTWAMAFVAKRNLAIAFDVDTPKWHRLLGGRGNRLKSSGAAEKLWVSKSGSTLLQVD
ncbi:unnamed protein product [Mesocestoides corti]|uniref:F-box/kelch-repeat protein n=1 Tax=Mesocestoides corti TaxID=53468 RepID=A0A0R3UJX6_MESCO|nr:unnamed protein product [Mesocestoides corti]